MSVSIKNGEDGKIARVNSRNQLWVEAKTITDIHWHSEVDGRAYELTADVVVNNSNYNVLYIKNTSQNDRVIIFETLQVQLVGSGATLPISTDYFTINSGAGDYSSGGTALTPTNLNSNSPHAAEATIYDNNPTLTSNGTAGPQIFAASGGVLMDLKEPTARILGVNKTLLIRVVTTLTTNALANVYARFYQIKVDQAGLVKSEA